jgi:hypothetical protein
MKTAFVVNDAACGHMLIGKKTCGSRRALIGRESALPGNRFHKKTALFVPVEINDITVLE